MRLTAAKIESAFNRLYNQQCNKLLEQVAIIVVTRV